MRKFIFDPPLAKWSISIYPMSIGHHRRQHQVPPDQRERRGVTIIHLIDCPPENRN
jgi:hypothetical protein